MPQLCRESQARSGSSGSSSTTLPVASTVRASNGSSSVSMAARPRRASTAAMVVFPAPEQPVIWTALIGVYRRPALIAGANEFVACACYRDGGGQPWIFRPPNGAATRKIAGIINHQLWPGKPA